MPKVTKSILSQKTENKDEFPVSHLSTSAIVCLSSNPILFKIKYVNRDTIDTTMGISGVLGKAFHNAMCVYYSGSDEVAITSESEAIEYGLKVGTEFLENYNDGFIEYSKTIDCKQKAIELFVFMYTEYIKQFEYKPDSVIATEEKIEEYIDVQWKGQNIKLPIKLKGYLDKIEKVDDKIVIRDYKTCFNFSDPDKIDGAKIIQAIVYYLLVYAKYGEEPYSIIYDEVKYTKNRDGGPQVKSYEMVYADNELYFDFFFRIYEDTVKALNGEMVYLPNVHALFENEVSIISYIHRLDVSEEAAKLMKKNKVENISDLLKKQIQKTSNMRIFQKALEQKFVSAKNINYEKMNMEEKIQTKLLEHGIMLRFDSKIEGLSVDLYQYNPSIGVKMARIRGFVDDIEQITGISGIRVLAPVPNTTFVGFEVPKVNRKFVKNNSKTDDLNIGLDTMGNKVLLKIEDMPHLLVAGTTGSGKSVFLHEVIRQCKSKYEVIICDPKGVDFKNGISEHAEIAVTISNLVDIMKNRYTFMKENGIKKWSQTGEKSTILLIDEYNDLYMSSQKIVVGEKEVGKMYKDGMRSEKMPVYETIGSNIDKNIKLLAQKARSAGIHIIIATQRPSVKVLDGDIKANFSTRVCFKLPTMTDSKVVLDQDGAEKLLGKGDGLLFTNGALTRFQAYDI